MRRAAQPVRTALSTSSAFAGNNAAIVLQRSDALMTGPVVITGIGVVSPLGLSAREMATRFCAGDSAVGPLSGMGVDGARGAAVVEIPLDVIPADKRTRIGPSRPSLPALPERGLSGRRCRRPSTSTSEDAERVGLSFGTGLGCLLTNAEYNQKLVEQGPAAASPRLFAYTVSSAAAGEVSIALGIKGPNVTAHAGLAAGLQAIGYGFDLIRHGQGRRRARRRCRRARRGAGAGPRATWVCLKSQRCACRSATRSPGVCPAEGAAVVVLERAEHARQRGAQRAGAHRRLRRRLRADADAACTRMHRHCRDDAPRAGAQRPRGRRRWVGHDERARHARSIASSSRRCVACLRRRHAPLLLRAEGGVGRDLWRRTARCRWRWPTDCCAANPVHAG